jgi:hypothetical protein
MRYIPYQKALEVITKDMDFFGLPYRVCEEDKSTLVSYGPDYKYSIRIFKDNDAYMSEDSAIPGDGYTHDLPRVKWWIATIASKIEHEQEK